MAHTLDTSGFDEFGRCLPGTVTAPAHPRSRRYFALTPPTIDYPAIHARLCRHLGAGLQMSADEFASRANAILKRLEADQRCAAITRGVAVPFILPRGRVPDIGSVLEQHFLPAVADAYQEKFPDYRFTNHHKTGLTGRLSVQPNSRHEHLIDAMADKDVVGVYFPCLSEYSIPAALQRIATLPEHLLLAGGFDTCAALVATPGLLMRTDGYPPLLWLSALASEKESVGYHFEAYGYNLTFNRRPHLGHAAEYWSSGISVLESC